MKLSGKTLAVLNNFSKINSSIIIRPGNILSTVSNSKTIAGMATISEEFDKEFAIYDLNKWLTIISFLGDPDIQLETDYMTLASGNTMMRYTYASQKTIRTPPPKKLLETVENLYLQFTLLPEVFIAVDKAMKILGLPVLAIIGSEGKLYLETVNTVNPSVDTFKIKIGETDKTFRILINRENLEIIPNLTYEAMVDQKGCVLLSCQEFGIRYLVAIEDASVFE